jgi:AAA domain
MQIASRRLGLLRRQTAKAARTGNGRPGSTLHLPTGRLSIFDETGRGHVAEVADNLRGIVPEIRIIDFRDLPAHGDVSDWLAQGGTKEELLDKAKAGRIPEYRFKLSSFNGISIDTTPSCLVKDLVPQVGLAVFWGPPKCGKSFFVFDLMMHVALGWKFRDLDVRQGAVVNRALEGGRAFKNRVEAFRRKKLNGHAGGVPFYLMASPLALVPDHPALIASIKGQCPAPAAIVIDTLNRSLTGSETSDEDMGNYIKAADAIRDAFNCVVIIVHHCGHEGTRPRSAISMRKSRCHATRKTISRQSSGRKASS